jgi:hypothetical protein
MDMKKDTTTENSMPNSTTSQLTEIVERARPLQGGWTTESVTSACEEAYRLGHDDIFHAMDDENQQLRQQLRTVKQEALNWAKLVDHWKDRYRDG